MTDNKLTDNEIVKACKDCLHYEACKGTYSSAKGDEDILYDFDGEMYANSGCEDFEDKDLINRLQAENERLKEENENLRDSLAKKKFKDEMFEMTLGEYKAEAYKEFAERFKKKLSQKYTTSLWKVYCEEIDNLLKELVGD